jgi:hypothetical protein
MSNRKYKKGDIVKVWSLQSFFGGGMINGREGIVSQDQGKGKSVLVAVKRTISGESQIDPSYEVYPQQLKLTRMSDRKKDLRDFMMFIDKLRQD